LLKTQSAIGGYVYRSPKRSDAVTNVKPSAYTDVPLAAARMHSISSVGELSIDTNTSSLAT